MSKGTPLRGAHLRWKEARRHFLSLPAGHADAQRSLTELANAEDALYQIESDDAPAQYLRRPTKPVFEFNTEEEK